MEPIKVILNPIAGRGYGARAEPRLRHLLASEGFDFDLERTIEPGHARSLAEHAATNGFGIVAAAGGDGTVNEVLNGLMAASQNGHTGLLSVIPVGSGSDFASAVNISTDLDTVVHRLAEGQVKTLDVGKVTMPGRDSRYFSNVVGIGFDGAVLLETLKIKHLRGLPLYMLAVLKTVFLHFEAPHVKIEYDGQKRDLEMMMTCVANGPREGGGFFIAPDARPDDGMFDLLIAERVSRWSILRLIPDFLRGTHVERDPVTMTRAERITISSPDNLIAHIDGEVLCTDGHQLTFEILPQRLRMWV
jgi:YegS/Rv2252/BmrU family lipid kinase